MPRPRVIWLGTSEDTRGGIATHLRTVRSTPLSQLWDIRHVVTHRDGPRLSKAFTFATAVWDFLSLCVTRRPALVHIHTSSGASFIRKAILGALAKKLFSIPVVLHVHSGAFDRFYNSAPRTLQAVVRRTLSGADCVIALGRSWREILLQIAPDANIEVVPNAIRVAPAPRQHKSPPRVLFLGRIGDHKGAFSLIRAWAKAPLASDTRLVLAGDGEIERARALVRELGLSSVDVLGWQSPTQVDEILSNSDIMVLASRGEGQPMAIIEAMARGIALVVSPVGGIPDLLTSGECLFVPPDDETALATALSQLVRSPNLRSKLGHAAYLSASRALNVEQVWRDLDRIYSEVARPIPSQADSDMSFKSKR